MKKSAMTARGSGKCVCFLVPANFPSVVCGAPFCADPLYLFSPRVPPSSSLLHTIRSFPLPPSPMYLLEGTFCEEKSASSAGGWSPNMMNCAVSYCF
uniref:Putative secreted peptide n=1 Tax=Anopheles braziliensis TaxID=58242 RepID=A0A2M3ZQH7_9DIPT